MSNSYWLIAFNDIVGGIIVGVNSNNKKTFNELLRSEIMGDLVLPDFQREFVWKIEQQKALAATFLTRIPLTSLLLLEGKRKDFGYKRLCVKNKEVNDALPGDNKCTFLLDGQQRLSTLKNIFSDVYSNCNGDWESVFDNIDNKLKYRWFLNLKPNKRFDDNGEYSDVFGIEKLSTPKSLDKLEPGDIIDYIECRKIIKGDVKGRDKLKWWHPAFVYSDNIDTPQYECKKRSADEYMIPLYKFYNDENADEKNRFKATSTISKIAKDRVEKLKAEINEEKRTVDEIFVGELRSVYKADSAEAWDALESNWTNAMNKMILDTVGQNIYFIELDTAEIGRAVTIFENMNASGTRLSVFDLVVARAAAGNKMHESLTARIIKRLNEKIAIPESLTPNIKGSINIAEDMKLIKDNEINANFKNAFISMLAAKKKIDSLPKDNKQYFKISSDDLKQNKILQITSEEIFSNVDNVVDALKKAYMFLQYRCGLISIKNLSYRLMIIPIACIFLDDNKWNDNVVIDRIECWYWSSLFSGAFSANQNNRSAEDVKKLFDFVGNSNINIFDERIDKIFGQKGYSDLSTFLGESEDSWNEAMHQGVLAYILSRNPLDFQKHTSIHLRAWEASRKTAVSYNNVSYIIDLQDHHLIPLCQDKMIRYSDSERYLRQNKKFILNSPLNRTYITAEANNRISKDKIDSYMKDINGYSASEHFIPSSDSLVKKKNEDDDKYYRRVLTNRFKLLSNEMKDELDFLKHAE